MPKYVVSSTLGEPRWSGSPVHKGAVLDGDVVSEISKLKQEIAGDIVVYASIRLVHTLMEHDLADELRLVVYPVVLGDGRRLFGGAGGTRRLRLIGTRAVGDSLVSLTCQRTEGT